MAEQKSPDIFKKLIQFMALMDSFHDFAQGERVPGGPINKRELFRLLNNGKNTISSLKSESYDSSKGLNIDENEYFAKGFIGNNSLYMAMDEKTKEEQTSGLVDRSSGGFEQGITKFLDGKWPADGNHLHEDYQISNSLYWDKWNLHENEDEIEKKVEEKGYWTKEGDISYTGNRPKLIIWKKDDLEAFDSIIKNELIKIFGADRELVFDYSAFNQKITKKLEDNGYLFKVSDSTMWDPATRKDATMGQDGEEIINTKPTSSDPKKYIYNTVHPYGTDTATMGEGTYGTENTQFCKESTIRLLGIKNGKGVGEIYQGKLIDFKKGRSVAQLGKFIRSQQTRRRYLLEKKIKNLEKGKDEEEKDEEPQYNLETIFLNEEESKIGEFSPDEYNCNALDMKRSGDWGQVAYSKEYGGIFYSGDRMAIMYAIIQKCPYIFTGSILTINGTRYSRMIVDPGLFDPKKFLETGIQDINIFYTENIMVLNKIYNYITNTNTNLNPFNILISELEVLKERLLKSIYNAYDDIKEDEDKKSKFAKYLTKFGGKILKLFEMINFINVTDKLQEPQFNLAELLSERISTYESIYKPPIKTYYSIDFSKFILPNKTKIYSFFDNMCIDITPDIDYETGLDSIDLLEPNIFKWSNRVDGIDIISDYNFTLHYNDELLYDKLKTLFFYFNNKDSLSYSLKEYIHDNRYIDSASILLAMIKNDYSELLKLMNKLPKYSLFSLLKQLYANNKELLNTLKNNSKFGAYTIYDSNSNLTDLFKYEIYASQANEKTYSEYISYYIHKFLFTPIYIIPLIINTDISKASILDNIFRISKRSGTLYPKNGLIPIDDMSLWQYYHKRRGGNDTPFFRIGANTINDKGKGWFGEVNSQSNLINLINNEGNVTQHNQLTLLYTILSYIVNSSHCDIHECTKSIDIDVFYKYYKSTEKNGFYYGLNNSAFKLRNSTNAAVAKNSQLLMRYNSCITNNIDEEPANMDEINSSIKSRYEIESEIDFSECIQNIDSTIKILINTSDIFLAEDYSRIIIPEIISTITEVDNSKRNKIYHLILVEFFKILKQAYILKSEHSNVSTEEEKFNWIVCDLKIELAKLSIYSIICHMPKRFTDIGKTTEIKKIYDEFEPYNEYNTNFNIDEKGSIYPNKDELSNKISANKDKFIKIITKIFNTQHLYVQSTNFPGDSTLKTIFNKIHNKLHNIHFIYNTFHYKDYYRNYKIINKSSSEKILGSECNNIENIDINIFNSSNNIEEILDYCNNESSENILKNIGTDIKLLAQHAPGSSDQIHDIDYRTDMPVKGTQILVKWFNEEDDGYTFWSGRVTSIKPGKSFNIKYPSEKKVISHTLGETWKSEVSQDAGSYSLNGINGLTYLLMNNNLEAYIHNIKNTISKNLTQSELFNKIRSVTKACVKNYYNKSN